MERQQDFSECHPVPTHEQSDGKETRKEVTVRYLLIFGFILISYIAMQAVYVHQHESAHEQIAKYHGCTDLTVKAGLFSGYVRCHEYRASTTTEMRLQKAYLDSINEIVGYQVMLVVDFLFLLSSAFWLFSFTRRLAGTR